MQEELNFLRSTLKDVKEETIHNYKYYTANYNNHELVIALSGIGKVNATVGTTLLIDRYNPDYVINTGSAGGFNSKLKIKDIVISSEVIHCDADSRGFGYKYGQIPQMPESYKANPMLIEKAEQAAHDFTESNCHKGIIGSGDSFISNPDQVAHLMKHLPNILAAEMESAAIAQTCYLFKKEFVIIRAISDIVIEEGNEIDFDKFVEQAGVMSGKLILKMLGKL